jgi:hypothetical protein
MRVFDGVTFLWPVEVMFDSEGQMFLHNGWRRFARSHALRPGTSSSSSTTAMATSVSKSGPCAAATTTLTRKTRRRQDEDDVVFYYVFIVFLVKFY